MPLQSQASHSELQGSPKRRAILRTGKGLFLAKGRCGIAAPVLGYGASLPCNARTKEAR
jgi:hypothetical protein